MPPAANVPPVEVFFAPLVPPLFEVPPVAALVPPVAGAPPVTDVVPPVEGTPPVKDLVPPVEESPPVAAFVPPVLLVPPVKDNVPPVLGAPPVADLVPPMLEAPAVSALVPPVLEEPPFSVFVPPVSLAPPVPSMPPELASPPVAARPPVAGAPPSMLVFPPVPADSSNEDPPHPIRIAEMLLGTIACPSLGSSAHRPSARIRAADLRGILPWNRSPYPRLSDFLGGASWKTSAKWLCRQTRALESDRGTPRVRQPPTISLVPPQARRPRAKDSN